MRGQEIPPDSALTPFSVLSATLQWERIPPRLFLERAGPGYRIFTILTGLVLPERKQRLHHLLSEQADATLAELGAGLDRPFRTSTIDLWLRRLDWKFKKNSGRRRTRTSRRRRQKGTLA